MPYKIPVTVTDPVDDSEKPMTFWAFDAEDADEAEALLEDTYPGAKAGDPVHVKKRPAGVAATVAVALSA